jgi:hypothetical protein
VVKGTVYLLLQPIVPLTVPLQRALIIAATVGEGGRVALIHRELLKRKYLKCSMEVSVS